MHHGQDYLGHDQREAVKVMIICLAITSSAENWDGGIAVQGATGLAYVVAVLACRAVRLTLAL